MESAQDVIVVELTAALDAGGSTQVFYLSDTSYATLPTDSPSNKAFEPALVDPGSIGLHAFSDGQTGGATSLEIGEIVINNNDGQFDLWQNYSFEGRPVVIRVGKTYTSYPLQFTTIFTGSILGIDLTLKQVVVTFKDKQALFQVPLALHNYLGNNALPNGLEGVATDLKGKPKPRVFGKANNISPVLVNTSKLTYQVNDGPVSAISNVYDNGVALANQGNYATSTLLQAATLYTGYSTCLAEGYFRLGSSPSSTVTADVLQGANAAARTAAQIMRQMALSVITATEISSSDVVSLDGANSAVVNYYCDDTTSIQDAMDAIANSVGAYYSFDPTGILRMGVLSLATGTPDWSFADFDIQGDFNRKSASSPFYAITINHTRNWTVQDTVAGSVTIDRRNVLAQEYASEVAQDVTVKNKYQASTQAVKDTLLTSATDAVIEANRQLTIYKTNRSFYEFSISLSTLAAAFPRLMLIVSLTYGRFGLDGGNSFRLIGINLSLQNKVAILTLWG